MDVNVKGTLLCCQVVGAAMAREGRGSIVNISSVYGLLSPQQDVYEFRRRERRGVHQAGRVLGLEVGDPQPDALPRDVLGEGRRARQHAHARRRRRTTSRHEFLEAYTARVPLGRMAEAREALGAVVFLASDASSYMTGANLVVDGGWSAW